MNENDADDIKVPFIIKCIFVVFLLALLSAAAFFVYKYNLAFEGQIFPSKERDEWGTLGDFFGGILNPIFGFASFLALLATIFYQSKELNASTKELRNSAEALTKQNKAIQLQSFEQTFFSWLNTYREVLNSIAGESRSGRHQLYQWRISRIDEHQLWEMMREYNSNASRWALRYEFVDDAFVEHDLERLPAKDRVEIIGKAKPEQVASLLKSSWMAFYLENEFQLDSLFRTAYKLLTWIDQLDSSRLSNSDKWLYVSIFRSQLSWIEMVFFFYNGLTEIGEKFKPIIEKYALFDNLNLDSDICIKVVQQNASSTNRYSQEAFDSDLAKKKFGMI